MPCPEKISKNNISQKDLRHIKNLARKLSKEKNVKRSEALEVISKDLGFKNWNNVIRFFKKNSTPPIIPYEKSLIRRKKMFIEIKKEPGIAILPSNYGGFDSATPVNESFFLNLNSVQEFMFTKTDRYVGETIDTRNDNKLLGYEVPRGTDAIYFRLNNPETALEKQFWVVFLPEAIKEFKRLKRVITDECIIK